MPEIIRYLGTNLITEVKDLSSENYKSSGERNRRGHKEMETRALEEQVTVTMSILLKGIYTFSAILTKIQQHFSQS